VSSEGDAGGAPAMDGGASFGGAGGNVSDSGGAQTVGGAAPVTGGTTGSGAGPMTGGATGGGAAPMTGGLTGGGAVPGIGGAVGGGIGEAGTPGATSGTGGTTPVAGSGNTSDPCAPPPNSGDCLGNATRYFFEADSGQCFELNPGCGESPNGFSNRGECLARCAGGEDRTRCSEPSECTLLAGECCSCSQELDKLVAVSKFYDEEFPGILSCPDIPCPDCEAGTRSPYLFVTCEKSLEESPHCAGYDARQHAITECTQDSDCRLRRGLSCCECSGEIVAVNVSADIEALTCDSGGCTADCDPPGFPALAVPICVSGRCAVMTE